MPYRKGYRRRRYKKKSWYNKKHCYSARDVAISAMKGVKYLKGLVNSEVHKLESDIGASVSDSGSITHLTPITQGDSTANRQGNSVLGKYLTCRGILTKHASATATQVRCMLFRDNQQVGDTSPGISDILQSTPYINSMLSSTTVGRFTKLYDKLVFLSSNKPSGQFVINLAVKSHVRFNGSASSDIQKNGLYLVLVSNEATNTPSVDAQARFGFYDN